MLDLPHPSSSISVLPSLLGSSGLLRMKKSHILRNVHEAQRRGRSAPLSPIAARGREAGSDLISRLPSSTHTSTVARYLCRSSEGVPLTGHLCTYRLPGVLVPSAFNYRA